MTLQFVLGKNGYDHQGKMIRILKNDRQQYAGDNFFYLVPNHIKFESEVEILKQLADPTAAIAAESDVQVLSFTRLAWFFLRNSPKYQKQRISQAGINMLLYQIILDNQNKLIVFSQEVHHPGFINQVAHQIAEMQAGNVLPEDLLELYENEDTVISNDLRDKLHDFSIIYSEYVKQIDDQYFDNHNILNLMSDHLEQLDLSAYHFYISDFSKFTAQESRLVETLISKAASVTVSLTLDQAYRDELPEEPNLFYQSAKLFLRLYKYAAAEKVPYVGAVMADQPRVTQDLLKLERYWEQSSRMGANTPSQLESKKAIQVYQADNLYSELDQVATMIHGMVASGQYRYSDFLILTRHLDAYNNILEPVFSLQAIPYFKDIQKSMVDHPLVELLGSLFDIDDPARHRNYQYDDVMRFLKSELVIPQVDGHPMAIAGYREAVSRTENLVLKNNYQGSRWTQDEDWQYVWVADDDEGTVITDRDKEITQQINVIRHLVKDTLPKFYRQLAKARTNRDAASILYRFLTEAGVVDQLQAWRDAAVDDNHINRSNQIEQVWRMFCSLLDESVAIIGDKPFVAADFWALIYAGFEGADYSQIPSTLDQVTVSESGMVQMNNHKVTFIIGANDDNMPARTVNESLFGDDDVAQLQQNLSDNQYLNDSSDAQMAFEPYLNYLAFMTPCEKLIFTYTGQTNDETSVQLSPYVQRIATHFGLKVNHYPAIPTSDQPIDLYVGTKRGTLHHLIQVIQAAYRADPTAPTLSSAWRFIFSTLENDPELNQLTNRLLGSIAYKNDPKPLKPDIVTGLYGDKLDVSISQLQSFYKNPYEYFLKYGLRLQEREKFELSSASTGTFFHEALDRIFKEVHEQQIDLTTLSDQDIEDLVAENVQKMITNPDNYQYVILTSSNRMKYLTSQLRATIQEMIRVMRDQQTATPMRPRTTEKVFGQPSGDNLKGLSFELPDNRQVNVRGRIDRIDSITVGDKRYFGIVDYKSGNKSFDYTEAYTGISMQLLTYLDVLKHNLLELSPDDPDASLAGALYLHIINSKLKTVDIQKTGFKEALLNQHKYQGILVSDPDLVSGLEPQLEVGSSQVYPYTLKKNGEPSKKSALISADTLEAFLTHTEHLIVDAANKIFAGDINLSPTKYGSQSAMQYTKFKPIMNFDPLLGNQDSPNNRYRIINKLKPNDIIKKLKEEK